MPRTARKTKTVDVLGIGFGPSNIALAIALEERSSPLDVHFIEAASGPCWQPQMLISGSDIQNNPLRDLVTPRNPCSPYSFTNYLKCEGRLFDYLNLGLAYPFRKDYARYVTWVAQHFAYQVSYDSPAQDIRFDAQSGFWRIQTGGVDYAARSLVLGIGRSRNIPQVFAAVTGPRVFHLNDYLSHIADLAPRLNSIAVVGASQSAVEINNDLMARFPELEIHAVHRGFAMRQKDTSPFSDHVYFPDFVDYFFSVDDAARADLQRQLRQTNYSAADLDVLHRLYTTIYEERLDGVERFHIHNNARIDACRLTENGVEMDVSERFLNRNTKLKVDAVVLATGFLDLGNGEAAEAFPPLLAGVADSLACRADGGLAVARDYRVATSHGLPLYLNGLCESSHGLGDAGSFSLVAVRALDILTSLEAALARPAAAQPATPDLIPAQ
jgi:L-ornithine N5-oxygenase